jgi:hypothetical protein
VAGFTNYLEAMLLDVLLRTQAAYKPAAIHVGLFTANPTDAGGGTEVTGGNYARQQVTQADAQWNAPAGTPRSTSNVNDIAWAAVTWSGTVTGWGIFDAATVGNLLAWFDCTDKVVNSGDTVKFTGGAPGALAVQLD